ncbi:LssY C-terminal domain-containing protein [Mesorhizobium sp. AaZ16]|uniref:LssY C-terminal domain-containing protein n=1 Tax=Mesorhizobium sp. AaZ16 TaxID=3402289 RepID=UPI00374FCA73
MRRRRMQTRVAGWVLVLSLAYGAFAYLVAPEFWSWLDRGDTMLPDKMVTTTPQGIPGDPINVGLVGSKPELLHAFAAAGWSAADAITWRSSLEIGESVLFDRPYSDAPVSTLVFDGRRQDLAFEKSVGKSADHRHHVRFWLMPDPAPDGRPLWLGSSSYDRGVGFSHDTGQITHHIGPDLDAERDFLMSGLETAGQFASTYSEKGVGPTKTGRNGGGDPYFTDGMATIGVLRP